MAGARVGQAPFGARLGQGGGGGGASTLAELYALATTANDNAITLTDTAGGVSLDGSSLATTASPFKVRGNNAGSLQTHLYVTRAGRVFVGASSGTPSPQTTFHVSHPAALGAGLVETFRYDLIPSSGTPAANDGQRWSVYLPNAASTLVRAATLDTTWTNAGAGSETATLQFQLVNAGTLTTTAPLGLQPTKVLFGSSGAYNTNSNRFGVGTSDPQHALEVTASSATTFKLEAAAAGSYSELGQYVGGALVFAFDSYGASWGGTDATRPSNALLYGPASGGLSFGASHASGEIRFYQGGLNAASEMARITANKNLLIGTATDTAATRLKVVASKSVASAAGTTWDGVDFAASTLTVTGSTNITNAAGVNYVTVRAPTLTAGSALQVDHAASLYIEGAPVAGGSLTFASGGINGTKALWVDAGNTRLDGDTWVGAASTSAAYVAGASGSLQFFGTTGAVTKQTVTGSRGGNAALASLLTALANYGLITNSTS